MAFIIHARDCRGINVVRIRKKHPKEKIPEENEPQTERAVVHLPPPRDNHDRVGKTSVKPSKSSSTPKKKTTKSRDKPLSDLTRNQGIRQPSRPPKSSPISNKKSVRSVNSRLKQVQDSKSIKERPPPKKSHVTRKKNGRTKNEPLPIIHEKRPTKSPVKSPKKSKIPTSRVTPPKVKVKSPRDVSEMPPPPLAHANKKIKKKTPK